MTTLSVLSLDGKARLKRWPHDFRLDNQVRSIWGMEVTDPPAKLRIIPDGQIDLIFDLDQKTAHITAPVTQVRDITHHRPTRLFGVSMATPFAVKALGLTLEEMYKNWTNLSELTGGAADSWIKEIINAPDQFARIALVESVLLARPSPNDPRLSQALRALEDGETIADIAPKSGASPRTLGRLFHRWVGMPPKTFARILRVQNTIVRLREDTPLKLIAADMGYSDQAHMTREITALTGMTPRELAEKFNSPADIFNL